jgi:hypothetical protein
LRNLFRRQIRRRVLRICVEQQKHVFSRSPIIDDAGAAPLSSRSNPDANLPYSATTFDQSAELRISGDPGLNPRYSLSLNKAVICLVKIEVSINSTHFVLSANGG